MRRFLGIAVGVVILAAAAFAVYWAVRKPRPTNYLVLYGNVDVRQVDIGFRVSGRVIEMPFQEGDLVTQGELMACLDPQPYADQVLEAKAAVQVVEANLLYAEQALKRRERLWQIGDGSISHEDFEQADANYKSQEARAQELIASLGVAMTNLCDTEVYCPNDGTILTRVREPGSVVSVAEPVYTLSLLSPVWITAFVPEPYLGVVYPGMRAEVFTDTSCERPYEGHVGFISPIAEFTPKTVETTTLRTDLVYRIRVTVDNPDWGLRQGMPVTLRLFKRQVTSDGRSTGPRP